MDDRNQQDELDDNSKADTPCQQPDDLDISDNSDANLAIVPGSLDELNRYLPHAEIETKEALEKLATALKEFGKGVDDSNEQVLESFLKSAQSSGRTESELRDIWKQAPTQGEFTSLFEELCEKKRTHQRFMTARRTIRVRQKQVSERVFFGPVVIIKWREDDPDRETHSANTTLAKKIWPQKLVIDTETGAPALQIKFENILGKSKQAVIPATAFVNRHEREKAATMLVAQGANVMTDQGESLIRALGTWFNQHINDAPHSQFVKTAGWSVPTWTYVSGHTVYGNDECEVDPTSDALEGRLSHAGSHETDKFTVAELASTAGLRLIIGMVFAGAIIEIVGHENFGCHLQGPSSIGKTSGARLGGSLIGPVYNDGDGSVLQTWNATRVAVELTARRMNSATLFLDEIKESDGKTVGKVVHVLADGQGRAKATGYGQNVLPAHRFRLTFVSTGEVTSEQFIGQQAQGGHSVRLIDVPIEQGELCVDAAHARQIDDFVKDHYGTVLPAFAKHLVEAGRGIADKLKARIKEIRDDYQHLAEGDGEMARIVGHIAVVAAALEEANNSGVLPNDWASELLDWVLPRIQEARGTNVSPMARALSDLRDLYYSDASKFPTARTYRHTNTQTYGIAEVYKPTQKKCDHSAKGVEADVNLEEGDFTGSIYTLHSMLKATGILENRGITAKQFTEQLEVEGLATRSVENDGETARTTIGGKQGRWVKIHLTSPREIAQRKADNACASQGDCGEESEPAEDHDNTEEDNECDQEEDR